jgi:hypothetical protein
VVPLPPTPPTPPPVEPVAPTAPTHPTEPTKPTQPVPPDPNNLIYAGNYLQYEIDYALYEAQYISYEIDYAQYETDYAQYVLDYSQYQSDYAQYVNDYTQYQSDYAQYTIDYAAFDYPQYTIDYAQYELDYAQYELDYAQYVADYNSFLQVNQQYQRDMLHYRKDVFNIEHAVIPKVMKELDTLFNIIVTMINDAVSPYDPVTRVQLNPADAPQGLDGSQFDEIFVRKYVPRFDAGLIYNEEDHTDYYSLYTIGNVEVNPLLRDTDGYSRIALSLSGDVEDQRLVLGLMDLWKSPFIDMDGGLYKLNVDDYYKQFTGSIGMETSESLEFVKNQTDVVMEIDNKRQTIMGVSLEEEMLKMMTYQHAYNASSRMVTVIDSMLDRVINGTGRVGL